MGRKPSWPPNSAAEWIVGQNFRSWNRKLPFDCNTILKVELSENEASGEEALTITYPKRRHRPASSRTAKLVDGSASARRVRFESSVEPVKSVLRKKIGENDFEETLVETVEDKVADLAKEEISSISETDTSEEEASIKCAKKEEKEMKKKNKRRKRRRYRGPKTTLCLKAADAEDSEADKDVIPHTTCPCAECKQGRMIMKAIIKAEARLRATEEKKPKEADPPSCETADTTETEADTTETETTEAESAEEETPQPNKYKKSKKKKNSDKNSFRLPKYPKELQPTLVMPTRARVVQVEHAVESPNDPAPNAFFDSKKGITRVYHGPRWSNHQAELYGQAGSAEIKAEPGTHSTHVPPPAHPPPMPVPPHWATGYPPPYWMPPPPPAPPGFQWAKPAMTAPTPSPAPGTASSPEDAWKQAASKGLGLSDVSAPKASSQVPDWQKTAHKTSSTKAGSDKASQKGGWHTSPAKDFSPTSPFDFTGFGFDKGEKFSRNSESNGSKKGGSVDGRKQDGQTKSGGWRDKNNDASGAGAWADSSNKKNDGWKTSGSNGDNAWGNNQSSGWGNAEKSGAKSPKDNKTTGWGNNSKSGDNAWGNDTATNDWGNFPTNGRSPTTSRQGDAGNASKTRSNSGDSGLGQGLFALPDGFPASHNNGQAKMPGTIPDSSGIANWNAGGGGQWVWVNSARSPSAARVPHYLSYVNCDID
ncbi:hypothetical protein BD289DRAFT_452389 [Coniella lustricola]|uniref:Uncharacterized protein n=1 Tax=Coniella lustricola TaxID=2025994 RepID=A0A2T3AB86_9PEZI|nr:hypothetical protein BD289DRAFT_452389 [Coniella lustricola]